MPPKKIKTSQNQPTLSEMFARQSSTNPSSQTSTGSAQESKQHFLIDLEIVHEENECGIDLTLLFHFDSHLLPGTSSQRIESETEVDFESAGPSASTSESEASMSMSHFDLEESQ